MEQAGRQEMPFSWKCTDGEAVILRWKKEESQARVPETIEGYPVTALGDYAFSEGRQEEIWLPRPLRRIGRYAFYNCFLLRRLDFHTSIADVGAGAFTGCHGMRRLDVTEVPGSRSCFRDILSEFSEELEVFWHGEGEARLMFPEYYEEGVENTPARILVTQVHGSGLYYRNCFVHGKLDFSEYDSRFVMACAQEPELLLVRLAMGRLFWPYRLEDHARDAYAGYLRAHSGAAGGWLIRQKDPAGMRKLAEFCFRDPAERDVLESLIGQAQTERCGEIVSYLMELRRRRYPSGHRILEL